MLKRVAAHVFPAVRSSVLLVTAAILVLASSIGGAAFANSIPALLEPSAVSAATATAIAEPALTRGVVRQRAISVNEAVIAPGAARAAGVFAVELFDSASVTVDHVRTEQRTPTSYTWYGVVRGAALSEATLTVVDGYVAGTIVVPGLGGAAFASYQILPVAPGVQYLRELDPSAFPPDQPPEHTHALPVIADVAGATGSPAADTADFVDVMIVYSNQTAAASAGIAAEIQQAVDRANLAYSNSGITTRLRLVHYEQVNYNESGDFNTDLDRLTGTADGYMDNVHTLRDTYGADVVSLFIENGAYCGLGWINSTATNAFTVVNRGCAGANLSFAHEVGHNFGAMHDPYVAPETTPYAYGHGYVYLPGLWRTVMAYNNQCVDSGASCTRIAYFSNPNVSYSGAVTGTAATSNAARVHNERALTMANFRQSTTSGPPGAFNKSSPANAATGQATSLTISWAASSGATSYAYCYDTTNDNACSSWVSVGVATSASLSGLSAGTTYYWQVRATNASGTTYANGASTAYWSFATSSGAAPTVTTNPASGVGQTGATLNGTVSSNGASTTVTFQYGTSVAYGSSVTATQSPVSGVSVAVSAVLTGLPCNTLHHFRAVGVNSGGTTNGADQTFTTAACAAQPDLVVTNLQAATTGTIGGSVSGVVATIVNQGAAAAGAFRLGFYFSTDATITTGDTFTGWSCTYSSGLAAGASTTCAGSIGIPAALAPGIYYFGAIADDQSAIAESNEANNARAADTGTVLLSNPVTAPTATTNAANAIGQTGATLNGTVSSNGASTTVTFQYGTTLGYGTTVTATQSPLASGASGTAVSATASGLACNTLYHYRVVANNSAGTTNGLDSTFTTAACAVVRPDLVVTNLQSATSGTVGGTLGSVSVTIANQGTAAAGAFRLGFYFSSDATITTGDTFTNYACTYGAGLAAGASTTCTGDIGIPMALAPGVYYFGAIVDDQNAVTESNELNNSRAADTGTVTITAAAAAPTVTTNAATGTSQTGATLNGLVSSNGASTAVVFDYGLTASYGTSVTAAQSPLAPGASNAAVSAAVSGLACNTRYHFRTVGTNSVGTTNGSDQTFTTAACPATQADLLVTNLQGGATGAAGGTMSGVSVTIVNQGSAAAGAFRVGFYFSTDAVITTGDAFTNYGCVYDLGLAAGETTTCSGSVSIPPSLAPGTYFFGAIVDDLAAVAESSESNNARAADTGPVAITGPAAAPTVSTNPATLLGAAGATLNGLVSGNGASTAVAFQYGTTLSYGSTATVAQSPVTGNGVSVSAAVSGLACDTLYHFRVMGTNSAGVANGGDQTFMTPACGFDSLIVLPRGTGIGRVVSNPAGVTCGADCSQNYALGTVVTLTASNPFAGSVFTGWGGGVCAGVGTCVTTISTARTVTATFAYTGTAYSYGYVQKAYVAYYGRPADPPGQSYWAGRMDTEGGSLNAVIDAFANSAEFEMRYGSLDSYQLVTEIYRQTLSRDPDPAGLNWYVGELNAGRRTAQSIALDVLNGASTAPDSTVVANKLEVAEFYSGKVANGCDYGTAEYGAGVIKGVNASRSSVDAAKTTITNRCGGY